MRVLAGPAGSVEDRPERVEEIWTPEELVAATGQPIDEVNAALALLRRHDVIVNEVGGVRFAAKLMRRWVVRYQLHEMESDALTVDPATPFP